MHDRRKTTAVRIDDPKTGPGLPADPVSGLTARGSHLDDNRFCPPHPDLPGRRGTRLLAHPLYEMAPGRLLGVTGLPTRSAVRNLFFAGREVVPGLGLEGELHAGLQAAAAAEAWLGKKAKPS